MYVFGTMTERRGGRIKTAQDVRKALLQVTLYTRCRLVRDWSYQEADVELTS
jgi:hypothetical protein